MTRFVRLPWAREVDHRGRMTNPETEHVMRPIRLLCKRLHLRCERNAIGIARGVGNPKSIIHLHSAGMWDLTVYLPDAGCAVQVECKMSGEGLEPAQVEWGKVYAACGFERIVATSVQQFLNELNEIRAKRRG